MLKSLHIILRSKEEPVSDYKPGVQWLCTNAVCVAYESFPNQDILYKPGSFLKKLGWFPH